MKVAIATDHGGFVLKEELPGFAMQATKCLISEHTS